MPRSASPAARRNARRLGVALTSALALGLAVVGCTGSDPSTTAKSTASPAAEAAVLDAAWAVPGAHRIPKVNGQYHWATQEVTMTGFGRMQSSTPGPIVTVDARTGKVRETEIGEGRYICAWPDTIADDGTLAVMLSAGLKPEPDEKDCSRAAAIDASTGELLWQRVLDGVPGQAGIPVIGASADRFVVGDGTKASACLDRDSGDHVADADSDPGCEALARRINRQDLPASPIDPDGTTVAWNDGLDQTEPPVAVLGRTDDVLLLSSLENSQRVVRAHDVATGRTLWQRTDPATDPAPMQSWPRNETWAVSGDRVLHISYDYAPLPAAGEDRTSEHDDALYATPMKISVVDPRTGEDTRTLGVVTGGLFSRQVGDVTVAFTHQERALNSTVSGFVLPD